MAFCYSAHNANKPGILRQHIWCVPPDPNPQTAYIVTIKDETTAVVMFIRGISPAKFLLNICSSDLSVIVLLLTEIIPTHGNVFLTWAHIDAKT